jgi:cytochrome oxidase Cu insertion factor (SCO1/SenC/PrrC family)
MIHFSFLRGSMRKILLFYTFFATHIIISASIPPFSFQDQYENKLNSKNLIGHPTVLIGCEKDDLELCRKTGRKLYWKMQNLLWKDSSKVKFVAYLNLKETNSLIEKYISDSKHREFESIYLDRKGELSNGLKDDSVYVRIYDPKGNEIYKEYLNTINDQIIKDIYEILKREIK